MIGRTNAGTGGGSGATLVITGVAGDICTITKNGKSKTKTFAADGTAIFKGLATGTWSVTMSNPDGDSVTQTVAINADYSLTIAYFAATIAITYPAGSTCTCSKDSTTFTAPDTTGSWTCTVPSTGTWTVSCTDGTDSDSKTVDITTDGESASVELVYGYYLLKDGELAEGVTWHGLMYSIDTFSNGVISSTRNDNNICGSTFSPKFSMNDWKTLSFRVQLSAIYHDNTSYCPRFGVEIEHANSNNTSEAKKTFVAYTDFAEISADYQVVDVDVSSLTGSQTYYISCAGNYTGTIDQIFLRP